MIVAPFALDWLNNKSRNRELPSFDQSLNGQQTLLPHRCIFDRMRLEGVFQGWKGGLGPVKRRNVHLVCEQPSTELWLVNRFPGHGMILGGLVWLIQGSQGVNCSSSMTFLPPSTLPPSPRFKRWCSMKADLYAISLASEPD